LRGLIYSDEDVYEKRVSTILPGSDEKEAPLNIINSNLKSLDLQLPTLSSSYIELITRYSPTQLNSLYFTFNEIDMYAGSKKLVMMMFQRSLSTCD
jgi:hypothetical protein